MQPLSAAAQNAKGMACEARRALPAAVAAFTAAAQLSGQEPDQKGELRFNPGIEGNTEQSGGLLLKPFLKVSGQ